MANRADGPAADWWCGPIFPGGNKRHPFASRGVCVFAHENIHTRLSVVYQVFALSA